jgi:hypothetical protein
MKAKAKKSSLIKILYKELGLIDPQVFFARRIRENLKKIPWKHAKEPEREILRQTGRTTRRIVESLANAIQLGAFTITVSAGCLDEQNKVCDKIRAMSRVLNRNIEGKRLGAREPYHGDIRLIVIDHPIP